MASVYMRPCPRQVALTHPINIYLFRNGVDWQEPTLVHIPSDKKGCMELTLEEIGTRMKFGVGYPSRLYYLNGMRVCHPSELEMYGEYVVVTSGEFTFRCADYGRPRSPILVPAPRSKHWKCVTLPEGNFNYHHVMKRKCFNNRGKYSFAHEFQKSGIGPFELSYLSKRAHCLECGPLCQKIKPGCEMPCSKLNYNLEKWQPAPPTSACIPEVDECQIFVPASNIATEELPPIPGMAMTDDMGDSGEVQEQFGTGFRDGCDFYRVNIDNEQRIMTLMAKYDDQAVGGEMYKMFKEKLNKELKYGGGRGPIPNSDWANDELYQRFVEKLEGEKTPAEKPGKSRFSNTTKEMPPKPDDAVNAEEFPPPTQSIQTTQEPSQGGPALSVVAYDNNETFIEELPEGEETSPWTEEEEEDEEGLVDYRDIVMDDEEEEEYEAEEAEVEAEADTTPLPGATDNEPKGDEGEEEEDGEEEFDPDDETGKGKESVIPTYWAHVPPLTFRAPMFEYDNDDDFGNNNFRMSELLKKEDKSWLQEDDYKNNNFVSTLPPLSTTKRQKPRQDKPPVERKMKPTKLINYPSSSSSGLESELTKLRAEYDEIVQEHPQRCPSFTIGGGRKQKDPKPLPIKLPEIVFKGKGKAYQPRNYHWQRDEAKVTKSLIESTRLYSPWPRRNERQEDERPEPQGRAVRRDETMTLIRPRLSPTSVVGLEDPADIELLRSHAQLMQNVGPGPTHHLHHINSSSDSFNFSNGSQRRPHDTSSESFVEIPLERNVGQQQQGHTDVQNRMIPIYDDKGNFLYHIFK